MTRKLMSLTPIIIQTCASIVFLITNKTHAQVDPEHTARQHLLQNSATFGMTQNLADLEVRGIRVSPAGYHVGFSQIYDGFPVMRAETVVSVNHEGVISLVISNHKPNVSVDTIHTISDSWALEAARIAMRSEIASEIIPPTTELVVYEDQFGFFHLTWKIVITISDPVSVWMVIVDANSGEILEKRDTMLRYVNGTGQVFEPDPVTALYNTGLSDQNNTNYPELWPAYDYPVTLNDINGDPFDRVFKVQGKYAQSENLVGPDPIVEVSDPDNLVYTRDQIGFEEVNIYYFIDKQRRYIGGLGFSPVWKYPAPGSDAIAFDARAMSGNSAGYNPYSEWLLFGGSSTDNDVDTGEDQSIILHEYGHALHDALIGGQNGVDDCADTGGSDCDGISEGLGDYLGVSFRRTLSTFEPNELSNWSRPGYRSLNSTSVYPDNWVGQGENPRAELWASTLMEIEYQNAIDPTQIRLGRDVTIKLVLTSLSYVNQYSTVLDNANAILQADYDILEYNAVHISELRQVFTNRGFDIRPLPPQNLRWVKWNNHPKLLWDPNNESDLAQYKIYRNISSCGQNCGAYALIATVGSNTTSYVDTEVTVTKFGPNRAYYYITAVDLVGGESAKSNTISVRTNQAGRQMIEYPASDDQGQFFISQNNPNPFNPTTTIEFNLPEDSFIELKIFNLTGREIKTLLNGNMEAGFRSKMWDGKDSFGNPVSSGMYLYHIQVRSLESNKSFSQTRKMVLMR